MSDQPQADSELRALQDAVRGAAETGEPLAIRAGSSKDFYGRAVSGAELDVSGYSGIVSYEPSEQVVTARAGTPLALLEQALAEKGQRLGFEPPHFGGAATIGGTIACGLSGPCRPFTGAARDFVLGVRMLNGRGQDLHFGGQVMKNVAGYDISRLMAGSLGTLGVLLEVSLRVLPAPARHAGVRSAMSQAAAIVQMNRLAGRSLPLSAACWMDGALNLRLSGNDKAVASALSALGMDGMQDAGAFWQDLRELRTAALAQDGPLWRLSLPPAAPPLKLPGQWVVDWGGAQRWLRTEASADEVRAAAAAAGGHAGVFRGGDRRSEVFHPLPTPMRELHERLKRAFDPKGVLNPGRMYEYF